MTGQAPSADGDELSSKAHWDLVWANPDPRVLHRGANPTLVRALQQALGDVRGKRILEAGCGTALDTLRLDELGAMAIGCDFSPMALATARSKAAQARMLAWLIRADIRQLPFAAGSFDAVFHSGVLEHFHDPTAVLAEQWRILKPGGVLVADVPQTFNLFTWHKRALIKSGRWFTDWETDYTLHGLTRLLRGAGFVPTASYAYGYYPPIWARVRWAASIGKGFLGRPLMPSFAARWYEALWARFEESLAFKHLAQCIGVVAVKEER